MPDPASAILSTVKLLVQEAVFTERELLDPDCAYRLRTIILDLTHILQSQVTTPMANPQSNWPSHSTTSAPTQSFPLYSVIQNIVREARWIEDQLLSEYSAQLLRGAALTLTSLQTAPSAPPDEASKQAA
jgi:hypothetical protein